MRLLWAQVEAEEWEAVEAAVLPEHRQEEEAAADWSVQEAMAAIMTAADRTVAAAAAVEVESASGAPETLIHLAAAAAAQEGQ